MDLLKYPEEGEIQQREKLGWGGSPFFIFPEMRHPPRSYREVKELRNAGMNLLWAAGWRRREWCKRFHFVFS